MKRRIAIAAPLALLLAVWSARAAYFHSEDLYPYSSSYWTLSSGSVTTAYNSSGGYGGIASTGGGTLKSTYTGASDIKLTIRTGTSGYPGYYWIYVNPTPSGNAFQIELNCYMTTLNVLDGLGVWGLSTSVACTDNMQFHVTSGNGYLHIFANNTQLVEYYYGTIPGAAQMSFGVDSGGLLTHVDLGALDLTAPSTISSITPSTFYNHVDLSWTAATDSDSGVAYYKILRGGNLLGTSETTTFSDTTVVPNSSYTYTIQAVDFFGNYSSTNQVATTPTIPTSGQFPSSIPEGRRVGVRSTGAYWGAGGENIDVMSGNLNYAVPLIQPAARGGMSASFGLSYNSQLWRQDSGGQWQYGRDVGYGYGWKLLAGSITPVFSSPTTISYYLFTDSTGAEYRLDQQSGSLWTSKESIYVTFDSSLTRLYFNNGTFWDFGCVSAASEPDAGFLYPTLMQDVNGNKLLIRYNAAPGAGWTNSSNRIQEIEDIRALHYGANGSTTYRTYLFGYDTSTPPHLTSITTEGSLNIGQKYTFTYLTSQSLASPFNSQSFGTTTTLRRITATVDTTYNEFTYNGSGELTDIRLPAAGRLGYYYASATYSSGRSFREVQQRYLYKDGVTSTTYPFAHESSPGPDVHQFTTLTDPSNTGQKYWTFATSGASMGLQTQYQGRQMPGATALVQNDFTWAQDAASNSYIASALTTADPGQSYQVQKKTEQTVDTKGNVTQVKNYEFNSLVTPVQTFNYTYLTTSSYVNAYIRNRLTQATGPSGTIATISYDQTSLTNIVSPIPRQWETTYGTSWTVRGNPTTQVVNGNTTTTAYDVTGSPVSVTVNGINSTATSSSSNNYSAPVQISTGSFSDTMSYDGALHLSNVTTPTSTLNLTYDSAGRNTAKSSYGSISMTTYNLTASPPTLVSVSNEVTVTSTLDGLGRPIKAAGPDGVTSTEYDSCGCSPTGKMKRTSLPYTTGGSPSAWTVYSYDGIGRTTQIVGPDGYSTTSYLYQGNTVKVTDPAGKWKTFIMNALGQLVQVTEPDPSGGSDYQTYYTYDSIGNLNGVSMPRPTGTQRRSFTYTVGGQLLSSTQPENGTTSYTYNSYNQIATKTDAKGQVLTYTYDGDHRLIQVSRGNPTEDVCQREVYSYDTNPYVSFPDPYAGTQFGRLTAVRYWGGMPDSWAPAGYANCGTMFTEMYVYNPGGAVTMKRLRVTRYNNQGAYGTGTPKVVDLEQTAAYSISSGTGAVHMTGTVYPIQSMNSSGTSGSAGPSLAWTYDSATGRPATMTANGSTNVITSVGYNVAGELTSMSGAYSETRGYNSLFQLTSLVAPGVNASYAYSATQNNGKLTSQTDNISGETVQYTYDALNRLATAQATSSSWGQAYHYDGFGNLTDQIVTAGSAPAWSQAYSASTNRIVGETADANGNIGSGTTYVYDIENRIAQVPGAATYYSYAPGNKRVYKNVSGSGEIIFYGINGEKIAAYAENFTYVYPNPYVLTLTQTGTWWYFGGKLVKNASGYVGQDRVGSVGKFFPYGQERSATANNTEKFATYYRDSESGLDYAQNRYHAPGQGRFLTADQYQASAGAEDPGSWNKYAYASGDPTNGRDSNGTCTEWMGRYWDNSTGFESTVKGYGGDFYGNGLCKEYSEFPDGLQAGDVDFFCMMSGDCPKGSGSPPDSQRGGGGGGGGGAPVTRNRDLLLGIQGMLRSALGHDDCAKVFGSPTGLKALVGLAPSAKDVLDGLIKGDSSYGSIQFSDEPLYLGSDAITSKNRGTLSQIFFKDGPSTVTIYSGTGLSSTSFNSSVYNAGITVLHELGHVLTNLGWSGGLESDRDPTGAESVANTNKVAAACGKYLQ